MASRQDSDAGAPTRWRSTHGLADPEVSEEDSAPRQPPPLSAWKSTGNLHGAGTLPRPWARPRTGTNVQKLLERLQSQEDGAPRSSWADQEDDGRTSDAPRAKLRSDPKAGTEERQRPRPRPRSMGELLGLTPKSEEDEEETRDEEAKRDEEATKDKEVPSTANTRNADAQQRRASGAAGRVSEKGISVENPPEAPKSVRNATRLFEALDSQARAPGLRASRARNENPPVRRPVSMAFGVTSADSYTSERRDDVPALSRTHGDAQHEESPPNVAVRTRERHHRARHGAEDTDDKQALHPSEPHAETLASAARYRDQTHSTGRLSATEAAIVRDIKKAAKAASGKAEVEEVETPVSSVTPEKRERVADENSRVKENGQTASPRNCQTPSEGSPKARSSESSPTSSSLASPVDSSPSSGSISFRRVHVKPTDRESDSGERNTEEKEGKVEVKVLSVEFKAGKGPVQSTTVEAEVEVVNDQKTENAEVHAVAERRSGTRAGRDNRKNKKKTPDAEPAEEPKYKPVAAPRRLTASGMSLDDQVVVSPPQTATRAMDLTAVSDDYKKMRPRGPGRLGNNKEARTKVIPMNERGSGLRARGEVQDFEKLRAECRRSGRLFEDPEFPATDCSIFFSRTPPRPFQWKRPHEICSNPKFISKGASRFDVQQGELGDCWLLAAVANITMNQELFAQIVPSDQEMDDGYAGIFHFRFWQYGRWVDVVIDDRLPTYHGQLAFMHSQDNREFWSALLEKAYAKLHGSYEALKGGTTCEAMEDFSGGVTEMYDIDKAPDNLFQVMTKAHQRQSLMSCSIEPDPYVAEAEMPNGLIKGHAYSVTKACLADIATPRVQGKIPMVRVRNPWGNEAEWKGAFSDKSPEWNYIPEETRRELGLTFDADGEFWMTFKDFTRNFQRLEICNLSPDSLEDEDQEGDASRRWEMSVFEGAWVRGATAGGCRNYINTFAHNPQYRIELADVDEDDEEKKCTVIVAVMQKNRRAQRRLGLDCLTIGFSIYHLSNPDSAPKPLDAQFFRYNCSVARAPSFINLREVSCRFKLPPGTYCIIPSTFEPNEEGEFLIRIFSEKRNNMAENDEDVGPGQVSEEITPELSRESEYDRAVRQFFTQIAGDNLEVDWRELKEVLDYALKKEFQFDGFSKDTIRSMVALLDVDNSGQLGLEEFKSLWSSIRLWKSVFKKYDKEGTSYLSGFQLRAALNESGYRVNNNMLNLLMHRYGDREGRVAFDDFMACAVKMKTCIEIFKNKDPRQTNKATFSLEDWMEHNMYS